MIQRDCIFSVQEVNWGLDHEEKHSVCLYREYVQKPDGGSFAAPESRGSL